MQNQQQKETGVSAFIHKFAVCISLVFSFYLAPMIIEKLREDMQTYLSESMNYTFAMWGSWLYIVIVILAAFYGITVLLNLVLNALIKAASTRDRF